MEPRGTRPILAYDSTDRNVRISVSTIAPLRIGSARSLKVISSLLFLSGIKSFTISREIEVEAETSSYGMDSDYVSVRLSCKRGKKVIGQGAGTSASLTEN